MTSSTSYIIYGVRGINAVESPVLKMKPFLVVSIKSYDNSMFTGLRSVTASIQYNIFILIIILSLYINHYFAANIATDCRNNNFISALILLIK